MVNQLLIGGAVAFFAILFIGLVFVAGMFYHSGRDGVVDLTDYQNTRLDLVAVEAVEEQLENATEDFDDADSGGGA